MCQALHQVLEVERIESPPLRMHYCLQRTATLKHLHTLQEELGVGLPGAQVPGAHLRQAHPWEAWMSPCL